MLACQAQIAVHFSRMLKAAALSALLLYCCAVQGQAQAAKEPQRGFHPAGAHALGDVETINTSSGNLALRIPLASLPAGRGGSPGPAVALIYNSKLWDPYPVTTPSGNSTFLKSAPDGNWRYGYGYDLQVIDKRSEYYAPYGGGPGTCSGASSNDEGSMLVKVRVRFPDGGQHEFRPVKESGVFYNQEGYYNTEPNGRAWYCRNESPAFPNAYVLASTSPTYAARTYYSADGTYLRLDVGFTEPDSSGICRQYWTLYFPDGGRVSTDPYIGGGVPGTQRVYDRNGNHVEITSITSNSLPATRIADQLGRAITVEKDVAANQDYVRAMGFGEAPLVWTVKWKTIMVNKTYQAGGGFGPQNLSQTFRVVESVTLPSAAGGLAYNFGYNAGTANPSPGWGEIISVTLPTGARADYTYMQDGASVVGPWDVVRNHPTRKDLTYALEYDGATTQATETWQYALNFSGTGNTATSASVTAPDGGVSSEVFINNQGHWDHALPLVSEDPDGTRVERQWMANTPYGEAPANPCVKTEYTSIRDAGGALVRTAIKDYGYDKNGNVTRVAEYDWVSYASAHPAGGTAAIPQGATPKRVTASGYYAATPDAADATTDDPDVYHRPTSPRLRSAVAFTEMSDAEQVLARTEFAYDNPATTANLTEHRSWDSHKGGTPRPLTRPLGQGGADNYISVINAYDPAHYNVLVSTKDPRGSETRYAYPTAGEQAYLYPTEVRAAYGTAVEQTATMEYDFHTGLVTRSVDSNNVATVAEYDDLGRPTWVKRAAGTPSETHARTIYSDAGRRVITRSTLDSLAGAGLVSVTHYDQLGRVRLARRLEASSAQMADAPTAAEADESVGIKVQTRYTYSGQNNYLLVSNPYRAANLAGAAGEETMGWAVTTSDRGGRAVRVETFGGAGLPAPFAAGGPNTASTGAVTTAHDAEKVAVTDQAGKQRLSVSDALGRLTQVFEAPDSASYNYQTSYTYDALGNLTRVTQGGQVRAFSYSSLSRLTSATNPEACRQEQTQCVPVPTTYYYDANGNLLYKTDARGVVTADVYDPLNRPTSRSYSDGTPTVAYFYDAQNLPPGAPSLDRGLSKGRLVAITYGGGSEGAYYGGYDELGRVTRSLQRTDGQDYSFPSYTYDLAGNLTSQTYPSGRVVKTEYDAAGRLAGVRNGESGPFYAGGASADAASRIAYTAHGAVSAMRLANNDGLWENASFNARLQPTHIGLGTSASNASKLSIRYAYGTVEGGALNAAKNNGNVQSQTITVPAAGSTLAQIVKQTYTYDALNRLESAGERNETTPCLNTQGQAADCWKQKFSYDPFGNRRFDQGETTWPAINQENQNATNPQISTATNRLTGAGYGYDAAGNLVCDPQHPCWSAGVTAAYYTYDAENRLESAGGGAQAGGSEYLYDGDGRRVRKAWGAQVTVFVYDAFSKLVAEYANSAPEANGTRYLTQDHLGSTRAVTSAAGEVQARRDYFPFGEEIQGDVGGRTTDQRYGSNDGVRQRFTSAERDGETGLDFMQARYYSSTTGRFTRPDPILSSGITTNPQTWNRYSYCLNNPLSYVDPTGMWNWSVALGGNRTDEQLRAQQRQITDDDTISPEDRQTQIMEIDNILAARQQFREAMATLITIAARYDLSDEERETANSVLSNYGTENDNNGVIAAVRTTTDNPAMMLEDGGRRIVAFTPSELWNRNLWATVFHEGVHLTQASARRRTGIVPSLASAESGAYGATASLIAAVDRTFVRVGMGEGGPKRYTVGSPPIVLYQRGWSEADMRNGLQQHIRRLGLIDANGRETSRGAQRAFPGGGQKDWQ